MSTLPADVALVSIAEVWAHRETFIAALSERERAIEAAIRIEKRRRDFLAGRIAAKRAIQRSIGCPFARISILASSDRVTHGRPEVAIDGVLRPDLTISISHSGDLAAASMGGGRVGFDLETVERRDRSFEAIAFTERELASLRSLEGRTRDVAVTRLWCKKEAIAKWKGVGFRAAFSELVDPDRARIEEGAFHFRGSEVRWARVLG
jgi:4'-phosphopantetheinyl transferase